MKQATILSQFHIDFIWIIADESSHIKGACLLLLSQQTLLFGSDFI